MHPSRLMGKAFAKTDTIASVIWDFGRWAWASYRRWRLCRETVRTLQSLDDRMLKDIGLDASEIESMAYTSGAERKRHPCRAGRHEI